MEKIGLISRGAVRGVPRPSTNCNIYLPIWSAERSESLSLVYGDLDFREDFASGSPTSLLDGIISMPLYPNSVPRQPLQIIASGLTLVAADPTAS